MLDKARAALVDHLWRVAPALDRLAQEQSMPTILANLSALNWLGFGFLRGHNAPNRKSRRGAANAGESSARRG